MWRLALVSRSNVFAKLLLIFQINYLGLWPSVLAKVTSTKTRCNDKLWPTSPVWQKQAETEKYIKLTGSTFNYSNWPWRLFYIHFSPIQLLTLPSCRKKQYCSNQGDLTTKVKRFHFHREDSHLKLKRTDTACRNVGFDDLWRWINIDIYSRWINTDICSRWTNIDIYSRWINTDICSRWTNIDIYSRWINTDICSLRPESRYRRLRRL